MNQITLIGRTGKDPEIKQTEAGKKIARFSLAVSEKRMKNGEKSEHTDWFNCTCFDALASVVEQYVKKGDKLAISGKINFRDYEKDGVTRQTHDLIVNSMEMLGGKSEDKPAEVKPAEPVDEVSGLPF